MKFTVSTSVKDEERFLIPLITKASSHRTRSTALPTDIPFCVRAVGLSGPLSGGTEKKNPWLSVYPESPPTWPVTLVI